MTGILVFCGFGTAATWEMRSAKTERDMFRRVNIMLVAAGTVMQPESLKYENSYKGGYS